MGISRASTFSSSSSSSSYGVGRSTSGANGLSRRTQEAAQVAKGFAIAGFFCSPINVLKYLGIAVMQALRFEGRKALAAFGLALSAPLWTPVDWYVQALEGPRQRWPRYGLESAQVFAEKGVLA